MPHRRRAQETAAQRAKVISGAKATGTGHADGLALAGGATMG